MSKKNLVIIESPYKEQTIKKYLGSNYKIVASMGHLRDLPKSRLGVDVEHDFKPEYIIPQLLMQCLVRHNKERDKAIDGIRYDSIHKYDEESFSATFRPDGGNLCPGYGQRQP